MQTFKRFSSKPLSFIVVMLSLTEEQQDEFYELVGRYGSVQASSIFGRNHNIPSVLLEGHLRRIKRIAGYTGHSGLVADKPPKATVADEEKTRHYEEMADKHLARQGRNLLGTFPARKLNDVVNPGALTYFCKGYLSDEDATCGRKAVEKMQDCLREWLKEMIESLRVARCEERRLVLEVPRPKYQIDGEFVRHFFSIRGEDPCKVSKEAAEAIEKIPYDTRPPKRKIPVEE